MNDGAEEGAAPLEARAVHRTYAGVAGPDLKIIRGANLVVRAGEAVAIVGASGSGKSTLLHVLGGLDRPTAGSVHVGGIEISGLVDDRMAEVRNRWIGFVFQFHHLLRDFTALENAMMPALIAGIAVGEARSRASAILQEVGLGGRLAHTPRQLSGGEQQRVAVARALVNEPAVLLADEPTGDLDADTSVDVQKLLFRMKDRQGVAMVVATHNRLLASNADRTLRLSDGVLEHV